MVECLTAISTIAIFLTIIAMKTPTFPMISVGYLYPKPGWKMRAHHHPFHEMIAPIRGILNVRIGGKIYHFGPGTLLLYAAGATHEEWADSSPPLESFFLAFPKTSAKPEGLTTCEDPDGRVRQLLRWMHQDQQEFHPGSDTLRRHFLQIILEIFEQGRRIPETEWIQNIRAYMRQHLSEDLSLDHLSRKSGFSRYHFLREYRRLTGQTPMADVRRMRADYARDLILTTSMPLKEIAPASGLSNEYALSRTFRQLFNMPPGEFRRMRRPSSR